MTAKWLISRNVCFAKTWQPRSEAGHQVLENWRRYGDFQKFEIFFKLGVALYTSYRQIFH